MHLVATKLPNLLKLFTGTIVINRIEQKLCKNKTLIKKRQLAWWKRAKKLFENLGKVR